MTAKEILEYFLSQTTWVDRQRTVDKVVAGDGDKDVDRCLVTWMPGYDALQAAVDRGISLVICHEPTFWDPGDALQPGDSAAMAKKQFILDHELVVLRNHDCWDRWPAVGITWAWAQFLGLGSVPKTMSPDGYQHRYEIDATTLDELAGRTAGRCASFGEPRIQVIGDGCATVSQIGVGAGCACDIKTFVEMGCDCSIVSDDGSLYWMGIQRAIDTKHPVIRANHGTAEEPGMITLTQFINENLQGRLFAEYLPHMCSYRLVGAQAQSSDADLEPTP